MKLMDKVIRILFVCSIIILAENCFAQSIIQRKISVVSTNQSIEKVLAKISQTGNVCLSYNSDIIPLDSVVSVSFKNISISKSLTILLGRNFYFKTFGNHIVILKKENKKTENNKKATCTISGIVYNSATNEKISGVTIFDISKRYSALTDSTGFYRIEFIPENESIELSFSKEFFTDTIVFLKTKNANIDIRITKKTRKQEDLTRISPREVLEIPQFNINDYKLVKLFVNPNMILHAQNLLLPDKRTFQFSILPPLSTNKNVSGAFINRISFNAIAGYSNGVDGVELGTLNISKQDVNGFQFSGLGNITGGNTNGLQIAGVFNRNAGNVKGFQLSGFSNIILDTLKGLQISCVNYVKTNRGVQFGLINLADSSDGVSIGFITVVKKGYYNVSLFTDEMLMPNAVFKMGTHRFYNIWGLSASKEMWGLTYGVGFHQNQVKKISQNYDLSFTNMSFKKPFETQICMKIKLSAELNYKLTHSFDLFGGLSYNLFVSDRTVDIDLQKYVNRISNSKINSFNFKSVAAQHWPGVLFGIKYMF